MYEHEIRWSVLVPVAILVGFAALFAETCGVWFDFPARPDWLWCLAVFTVMKAPPVPSIGAFACCGLVRDLLLGPRPGAASIAFILTGWAVLYWKPVAALRGWRGHLSVACIGSCMAALLKHALDYGQLTYKLWYWVLTVSMGDALLTLTAYPLLAIVLTSPSFRPWREKSLFTY